MTIKKGIILAGGSGSRLYPITKVTSKSLLNIYDKPMIYYSLSTLMIAGIKDILIICKEFEVQRFKELLGDGAKFGISIKYKGQQNPDGIAQAFLIAEDFINNQETVLLLGDNLFYGTLLGNKLKETLEGSLPKVYVYRVKNPENYGVINFDNFENILRIDEKPKDPKSNYVITGIYFLDASAVEKAKILRPSLRGELEISDLLNLYIKEKKLKYELLGRGIAWLDTGTVESMYEASSFVRSIENRQGFKIYCPEEIAWRNNWISDEQLSFLAYSLRNNAYGKYLKSLLD